MKAFSGMPFLDTKSLPVIERLPGWFGRCFHFNEMTFAHYDFTRRDAIFIPNPRAKDDSRPMLS